MKLQREITQPCRVFEENGQVMQAGWARSPLFEFNESDSKARLICRREGFFVNNGEVSLYVAIESFGREFSVKIAIADLLRGGVISDCITRKSLRTKEELPEEYGDYEYCDKRLRLQLTSSPEGKVLKCLFDDFGGKQLFFNIFLKENYTDSMNELAPFERNRKFFFFKRFSPTFTAQGIIKVGSMEYYLKENTARAYHDKTRFAKPRPHSYQRLGADCLIDGKRFTLSLASRVGDNRYGNENCFFFDGKLEKLSHIDIKFTPKRIDRPFYFRGGISALDITFKPFTLKGKAMRAEMGNTTVLFGRLFGSINRVDFEKPLELDNVQAHLVLSDF